MAGSQRQNKTTKTASTSSKGKKTATATKEPPKEKTMDESTDTNIKDASGDTIMETTEDTAAAEYDSEGNNLYEEDDAVSASDKTEVANN